MCVREGVYVVGAAPPLPRVLFVTLVGYLISTCVLLCSLVITFFPLSVFVMQYQVFVVSLVSLVLSP